jgi:hypothetical protein
MVESELEQEEGGESSGTDEGQADEAEGEEEVDGEKSDLVDSSTEGHFEDSGLKNDGSILSKIFEEIVTETEDDTGAEMEEVRGPEKEDDTVPEVLKEKKTETEMGEENGPEKEDEIEPGANVIILFLSVIYGFSY